MRKAVLFSGTEKKQSSAQDFNPSAKI